MIFIYLAVGIMAGIIGAGVARNRGQNPAAWGIVCFIIPIALLFLFFIPEETQATAYSNTAPIATKAQVISSTQPNLAIPAAFEAKWDSLSKYDPDIKQAVETLNPHGTQAIKLFKKRYSDVELKEAIPAIVADIIQEMQEIEANKQKLASTPKTIISTPDIPQDEQGIMAMLIEKGYKPRKTGDSRWVINEPLGGRRKCGSFEELSNYAMFVASNN